MKRTVTIEISGTEHSLKRFAKTWHTGRGAGEIISFESPEVLFRRITPKRWTLLTALQAAGPHSVRELARIVERDVKNVHGDVQALIEVGLVERAGNTVRVPFDEIRAAFTLTRAARGTSAQRRRTDDLCSQPRRRTP